jgi:hypothetical protein
MNAVHAFPFMVCSLAAMGGGFTRVIEGDSEGEAAQTALRLVMFPAAGFLLCSGFRLGMGMDIATAATVGAPRFACWAGAAVRAAAGCTIAGLCWLAGDKAQLVPSAWCFVTMGVMLLSCAVEAAGCVMI